MMTEKVSHYLFHDTALPQTFSLFQLHDIIIAIQEPRIYLIELADSIMIYNA